MFQIDQSGDGIGNSFLLEIAVHEIAYDGTNNRMYVCMYVRTYVCIMYVCTYVCMCV